MTRELLWVRLSNLGLSTPIFSALTGVELDGPLPKWVPLLLTAWEENPDMLARAMAGK
jgi:hypothetical protein